MTSPSEHLAHAVSHFEPPALFGIQSQSAPTNAADAQYQALAHLIDTHAVANSEFHVVGEGFHLARNLVGPSAIKAFLKDTFVPAYHDNLDTAKSPVSQPPEIIGNPEAPNATFAMVFHGESVSKSGKPWVNDAVFVIKTNEQAKWADVRLYLDTLHLQNHIKGTA